jgi:hypothetical protein
MIFSFINIIANKDNDSRPIIINNVVIEIKLFSVNIGN